MRRPARLRWQRLLKAGGENRVGCRGRERESSKHGCKKEDPAEKGWVPNFKTGLNELTFGEMGQGQNYLGDRVLGHGISWLECTTSGRGRRPGGCLAVLGVIEGSLLRLANFFVPTGFLALLQAILAGMAP